MLQCSSQMCLRKTDIAFKKGSTRHRDTRKEPQSLSFPPSHMPSVNGRTLVSHIGHSLESVIAVACNFSPCEPPQNKLCTSSATPAPCDSKKNSVHLFSSFRPTSVLLRFVCFLLSHSAMFTARLWRWDSSAPGSCTDHIEIKDATKDGMRRETFLKSSWSSRVRLHHQIFSRL